ncbi:hypothetical protein MJ904_09670 [Massilia sp. MB5]|uniref:hypothetical protein n=1 Tax=Massilia sp. MB5 TaxID=2919578 RepID=UPI001F0EAA54|nr:hypothetical protein [Massilia sp. MB5]UMR32408.1 hypothetical protein MJ904_09670 [Massilia sp. MB5]
MKFSIKKTMLVGLSGLLLVLVGCATPPSRPAFSPDLMKGNRQIAIILPTADLDLDGYGIRQTEVAALPQEVVPSYINGMVKTHSDEFTKLVLAMDGYEDLYKLFVVQLVQRLSAGGYDVFEGSHAYLSREFKPATTKHDGREWVFYLEGMRIQYFADTLISNYIPRTGLWLIPYNSKTDTLYQPILIDKKSIDKRYQWMSAEGVKKDVSTSFTGMKANTIDASLSAFQVISGQ